MTTHTHSTAANWIMVAVTLAAAGVAGLEVNNATMLSYGTWIHVAHNVVLAFFIAEYVWNYLHRSVSTWKYVTEPWHVFDLLIILMGLASLLWPSNHVHADLAVVFRLFRILRVAHLFEELKELRRLTRAVLLSLPSLVSIILFLLLHIYMSGIVGVVLFDGDAVLGSEHTPGYFDDLGTATRTLFFMLTGGGDISEIYADISTRGRFGAPAAIVFLGGFVIVGGLVVLNLLTGSIVDAVNTISENEKDEKKQLDRIEQHILELQTELKTLKSRA
ncbi:hypothetical protein BH10BAC6_BH10BAC6_05930 [soil metagenome]